MLSVTEHAYLPVPPDRVWRWFTEEMVPGYLDWHPEHVAARALTGLPLGIGSVIFFDEWIGRFRLSARFRAVEMLPPTEFSYRALFPHALINAGGSFTFQSQDEGTRMTAEVHFGWRIPVLGPVLDALLGLVIPVRALRRHMADEGRNLAVLLDTSAP